MPTLRAALFALIGLACSSTRQVGPLAAPEIQGQLRNEIERHSVDVVLGAARADPTTLKMRVVPTAAVVSMAPDGLTLRFSDGRTALFPLQDVTELWITRRYQGALIGTEIGSASGAASGLLAVLIPPLSWGDQTCPPMCTTRPSNAAKVGIVGLATLMGALIGAAIGGLSGATERWLVSPNPPRSE